MPSLSEIQSVGLLFTAVAVLLYFSLRQMATRFGDDLYELFKRLVQKKRRSPSPPSQGVVVSASHQTVLSSVTPAVLTATRSTQVPSTQPPAKTLDPAATDIQPTDIQPTAAVAKRDHPPTVTTPQGSYYRLRLLATGDFARLYRADFVPHASDSSVSVVLKLSADIDRNQRLQHEVVTLRLLREAAGAQEKHLPEYLDQFRGAEGRLGTVFAALDGYTLTQLRQHFPAGVEPRHVLWIFRRCLSVLGMAHGKGILHGHLTPDHILVRPSDHNLWLLDWCVAIHRPAETGETFQVIDPVYSPPEAHRGQAPLPASDLYALARCMIFALGGDPVRATLPATVPAPLERMIRALLKDSPVQRPQDAWELYRTLETIRDNLYGPHRFVEFVVDGESAE